MCICPIAIGMSSHIHMIIGRNSDARLEGIIRDIKKYTSAAIIKSIKENPQQSRRALFMWLFERAGKENRHNTKY